MSLEEFYSATGADLAGVRARLLTDERIEKFVGIFFADPSFDELIAAMDAGDMEAAFRAAHTLKGTCKNMGFEDLAASATDLAEALRPNDEGLPKDPAQAQVLLPEVVKGYSALMDAKPLL